MSATEPILFDCPLTNGLHARPATELAAVCEPFDAKITCINLRTGHQASAFSVLGLISADIRHQDSCEIHISGNDADSAHVRLAHFVGTELVHCDDDLPAVNDKASGIIPRSLQALTDDFVLGQSVSQGVGIGVPLVLSGPHFPQELLAAGPADNASKALTKAHKDLLGKLKAEQHSASSAEAGILAAHLAILNDSEFSARLQIELDSDPGSNPATALAGTVNHFDRVLHATGNPYLMERALDIQDICMRLLRLIYGDQAAAPPPVLETDSVVVAIDLTPSDFVSIRNKHLAGLVLESGGQTSHTIILARAAGIPAVIAAIGAVDLAHNCKELVVADANAGLLVNAEAPQILDYYRREQNKDQQLDTRYQSYRDVEAMTADGKPLEIAANIALAGEAAAVFEAGAGGIGLFRTEMLLMDRQQAPTEEEQYGAYKMAVKAAQGRPVIIRTFDIGGDKVIPWLQLPQEDNPFLGVRAVRLYPQIEALFESQLRALLRAAPYGDLRIMIPMITSVDELRWVRGLYDKVKAELSGTGQLQAEPKFGIMLEVPAAALILDKLSAYCDFISIGSNDLSQYFLACDRGNARLGALYSAYHPAFLRFLKNIVGDAKSHGLETGICGEMASDPRALPLLVGLGLDEISISAPGILRTRAMLATLDSEACDELLTQAMDAEDSAVVQQLIADFAGALCEMQLFDEDCCLFLQEELSKEAVVKQLVDRVHLAGRCEDPVALEEAIWQREDVFSTGLGFGIAIPHCKSSAVAVNSLCIARFDTPLDWGSRDGKPVDTVIALMIRDNDSGDTHLKIFAQLARKIMHEDFRAGLRACNDAPALFRFLNDIPELKQD